MCDRCTESYGFWRGKCADVSSLPCFLPPSEGAFPQHLRFVLFNGSKQPTIQIYSVVELKISNEKGIYLPKQDTTRLLKRQEGVFYIFHPQVVQIKTLVETSAKKKHLELKLDNKDYVLRQNLAKHHAEKTMQKCFNLYEGLKQIFHCYLQYFENKL
jgi:hypothetical protein